MSPRFHFFIFVEICRNVFREQIPPFYRVEVVKRSISMALDRDNRCRELTSQFLAKLTSNQIVRVPSAILGFEILLQRVEDLRKDVPDVQKLLARFLARAIVDEVLFPSFLDSAHVLPVCWSFYHPKKR